MSRLAAVARVCVLLSLLVPVIWVPDLFWYPFVTPKVMLLRAAALAGLAAYVPLAFARERAERLRLTPITLAVLAYVASAVVSTVGAEDVHRALWDGAGRSSGLVTLLHFVVLYLVATAVFRGWAQWRRALAVLLVAASVVFVVAIAQSAGLGDLPVQEQRRPPSLVGNPVYVGSLAMFSLFLAWLLAKKGGARWTLGLAAVVSLLATAALVVTQGRGAFLAVVVGALVLGLSYRRELGPRARRLLDGGVVLATAAAVALWFARDSAFVGDLPLIGRFTAIDLTKGSTSVRVQLWHVAADMGAQEPLTGWGIANFYHGFNNHFPLPITRLPNTTAWADNAHNAAAHHFAEQGALGVLTYLGLYVVTLLVVLGRYEKGRIGVHDAAVAMALLSAHFVHGLFAFDDLTSRLCLVVYLAYLNSSPETDDVSEPGPAARWSLPRTMGAAVGCGAAAAVLTVVCILPLRANVAQRRAIVATVELVDDPVARYEAAVALRSPHRAEFQREFAAAIPDVVMALIARGELDVANDLLNVAYEGAGAALTQHPLDVRAALAISQLAEARARRLGDPAWLADALAILEHALDWAPDRPDLRFAEARNYLLRGETEDALLLADAILTDEEGAPESWWMAAWIMSDAGDHDGAVQLVLEARERELQFSQTGCEFAQRLLGER